VSPFNSKDSVSPLDYDFSEHVPGVKGTIPEPTGALLDEFRGTLTQFFNLDGELKEKNLTKEDQDLLKVALIDALADVCAGSPTREQIEALPYRPQLAFIKWMASEILNPM
jgi:hypothetical protein